MNERREDLSTADLAAPQSTDTTRADRMAAADVERRDPMDEAVERRDPVDEAVRRPTADELPREGVPPAQASPDRSPGTASTTGPLLAAEDAEGFRARWTDIQTGFVDAPRQAVEQADALVAELMQHLARTFADERGRLEGQWDRGDEVPTDNLRDAFQRYRSFFERLLAT
jgi:hypothetical protein